MKKGHRKEISQEVTQKNICKKPETTQTVIHEYHWAPSDKKSPHRFRLSVSLLRHSLCESEVFEMRDIDRHWFLLQTSCTYTWILTKMGVSSYSRKHIANTFVSQEYKISPDTWMNYPKRRNMYSNWSNSMLYNVKRQNWGFYLNYPCAKGKK